jgi:hypothetical protein
MTFVSEAERMNELRDGVIRPLNAPTGQGMRLYRESLPKARPALVERDVPVIIDSQATNESRALRYCLLTRGNATNRFRETH